MNILLVVDMQNDFITGSLGTEEARAILPAVVRRIENSRGEMILFTQDTHTENYLQTQEGISLPVAHCIRGTEGWRIHSEVYNAWRANRDTIAAPGLNDHTLTKGTFGCKELVSYLETLGEIDAIEIIGLCTDICVISNALLLKAFLPETRISVDADCCAGVTPESHEIALQAMRMCQIRIVNGGQ